MSRICLAGKQSGIIVPLWVEAAVHVVTPTDTLSMELRSLLARAAEDDLRLGEILEPFPVRGHALMIVLFSFPMSLPVAPPFLGGPFGLVLALLGLYLTLGRNPWLPRFLRDRRISSHRFRAIVQRLIRIAKVLESFLHPRILLLTDMLWLRRCHAIYVLLLALLLAMPVPLPVPFSNTVVAFPIFIMGLGLLERDGVFVLLGYLAALPCLAYYGAILWLGQEGVELFLRHYGF